MNGDPWRYSRHQKRDDTHRGEHEGRPLSRKPGIDGSCFIVCAGERTL